MRRKKEKSLPFANKKVVCKVLQRQSKKKVVGDKERTSYRQTHLETATTALVTSSGSSLTIAPSDCILSLAQVPRFLSPVFFQGIL